MSTKSRKYTITAYTRRKAKALGLTVKPSTNKNKKIDVFNSSGKKLASIGANGMKDYPTYIKSHGLQYANARRMLYKKRHEKDRHIRGSNGWFADKLLW
jgi:hypothetical protein